MKNSVFILLYLGFSINGEGQNLVPNYSFENYTTCPSAGGQLYLATPWMAIPTNDLEYFNSCSTDPNYSVPNQGVNNFQVAKTGNAFIGFLSYNIPGLDYREYAQVQLISPLLINTCYYVEFFTNRTSGLFGGKYANNNIACSFTNSAVTNTGTGYVLNLIPHVIKFGNPIITDTLIWTIVSGVFVASGGENFLTIGNFSNDANTDTLDMLDGTYAAAAYFIDDVSVIPIDSIPGGIAVSAGNDTTILIGDSVFVGQQITGLICNWYIGATLIADSVSGLYVSPTVNTTYIVEQNLCGNITYDTVTVYVSGVGINENDWSSKINLYPNPNSGEFKIECEGSGKNDMLIEITDIIGRIVYTENLQLINGMCNIKLDIRDGVYFAHITNPHTNESVVKRIIIQK